MSAQKINMDAMGLFPSVDELPNTYSSRDAMIAIANVLEAARGAVDEIGSRVQVVDESLQLKIAATSEVLASQAIKTLRSID